MSRLRIVSAIAISVMLALALSYALLLLNMLIPSGIQTLSRVTAGVIIGFSYAVIGWPTRDIPPPKLRLSWYSVPTPIQDTMWLTYFFHVCYGALFFYIAAQIGHGSVFGMDFTDQGDYPARFVKGSIPLITLLGCFWGMYVFGFGHLDYVLMYKNLANIILVLTAIGGLGFSYVFSVWTRSPFLCISFITCLVSGIWVTRRNEKQLAFVTVIVLAFCFSILPALAILSA